ncbi:hypothetical protein ASD24_26830 [Paenibacillus sp. Root52]|nr:hypothetical protein ASD24_26830 [Paenibacillus sp. Root52]
MKAFFLLRKERMFLYDIPSYGDDIVASKKAMNKQKKTRENRTRRTGVQIIEQAILESYQG